MKIKKKKTIVAPKVEVKDILANFNAQTKTVNETDRTLICIISTKNPDRSNDEVLPMGMDATMYLKNNPVVLPFHNYREASIAKCLELTPSENDVKAKIQFPEKGINPTADMLFELYKGGFMNAWSIGFRAQEYTFKNEGGMIISKWELYEFSAVAVPDNGETRTLLASKGLDFDNLDKKCIDESVKEPEKKETEKVETKEGRVLSDKNRTLVSNAITQMKEAANALDALLQATEPKQAKSHKETQVVINLTEALKVADQVIGKALRDAKFVK